MKLIFFYILGIILTVIGLFFIVINLNLFVLGYSFAYFVYFIISNLFCNIFFINNITFNFLDKYYPFYEWLLDDELVTKKCYVYKVSSNILNDLIEYNIILDKSFLKDVPLVFCDDYTAVGVQFNSNGESIYKSSLLLTDEEKILNYTKFMKKGNINYKKKGKQIKDEKLRNEENIKNKILYEVDKLIKNNDMEKFKFIYYEWFNKDEKNIECMKKNITKKLNGPISESEKKVYDLIKLCYKTV